MKNFFCALAVSVMTAMFPDSGSTQSIGIKFDEIPVGTQMFYQNHKGEKWREVYKGKRGKRYIMNVYSGHSPSGVKTRTEKYDLKGRLVQYSTNQAGLRFRFRPYRCDYELGSCTYKKFLLGTAYVDNGSSETFTVVTTKKGDKYNMVWTRPTSIGQTVATVTLTKYNLRLLDAWGPGNRSFVKLVKIE